MIAAHQRLNVGELEVKRVVIAASSSGNNTVIAAVTGKKILVMNGSLTSAGSVSAYFRTGAAGADISGVHPLVASSGFSVPYSPVGNFETVAGEALILNLSGAVAVGGWLVYLEIPA